MSSVGAAIGISGLVGAGASLAGGAMSANAAGNAAQTQAGAAEQAQQLQATEAQNALNFQKQEFSTQQQNEAPWLTAGTGAVGQLSGLTSTPGQGLLKIGRES